MLNLIFIAVEALLLGAALLALLTLIGLGVTRLLPAQDELQLLLAPAVGLGILVLAFQWLTFLVPPRVVAVVVLIALGGITAVLVGRGRAGLLAAGRDVAGAAALMAAFYLGLMQIVVQRGVFTLSSFPADNIFIYAQAAQYLRDHPMPSTFHAPDVANPGSFYLTSVGPSFPNSVGTIDAAASALTGLPVHGLFDPINALALALTVGPVWYMVRANLGGSHWAAALGAALLAANQLIYWVAGVGLQQESLALPIFTADLCIAALAFRTSSARAGILAGILAAALAGLYLPVAGLFLVCVLGCALTWMVLARRRVLDQLLVPFGAAVIAGVLGSLAALYVLFAEGGLGVWLSVLGTRVAAGGISRFPSLPYLLGTLPFAHVWELNRLPLGRTEQLAWPALIVASGLFMLMIVVGDVGAVVRQRAPEAALLIFGLLFVGYEGLIAQYPYAFVKSIGYVAPLTAAFAAYGAVSVPPLVEQRWRKAAAVAGVVAALLVLLASGNATRDMLRLWISGPPALTRADLQIGQVALAVPTGSSVLIEDPTTDYGTLVRVAAIAYFLPDRRVRVYVGDTRLGTFADQNVRAQPCAFDYVITAQSPGSDFADVYTEPITGLTVFRRTGSEC